MKKITTFVVLLFALTSVCFAADFDGYVVKLKENTASFFAGSSSFSDEASLFSEMDDEQFAEFLVDEISGVDGVSESRGVLKVTDEETLDELISLGVIEYFEENIYYDLFGYDVEANAGYANMWHIPAINADFAWDAGIYGNGVNVGVIDSGVYKHADLNSNLIDGRNYNDESGASCNDDNVENGHGTAAAGVIASVCNTTGSVGVAFKSKVVPLRVINSEGRVSLSDATDAIYDAVDYYGCKVINLSFGSTSESKILYSAIKDAIGKGVIVVAASGNVDAYGNAPRYPAYHPEVISVANAEKSGSSYLIKASSISNEMVDVAAPGTRIYTTMNNDSSYAYYSGTSFAAPVVSAAAALAKSVKPDITQQQFESLIKSTANSSYITSSNQTTEQWGAGLLDVEAMLKALLIGERYYVSATHTVNDESYFCVTNMTAAPLSECLVKISEIDGNGSVNSTILKLSLAASEAREISLAQHGFTRNATVSKISHVPGDVNNDGFIDILDASVILRLTAGYEIAGIVKEYLDVNGDGFVDILDASHILRYCAGYDVEFH